MNEELIILANALLGIRDLTQDEFSRLAVDQGWELSAPIPGILEAQGEFQVVLDGIQNPPLIVCTLFSAEEIPRPDMRSYLRDQYESTLNELRTGVGQPNATGEWGEQRWRFAKWRGSSVVVSLEESDFERTAPLLVLVAMQAEADAEPVCGLMARHSAPG